MQDWRRAVAQSSVGQIGQGELEPPTGWPASSSSVTTTEAPRRAAAATRMTAAADRLTVLWERTRSTSS